SLATTFVDANTLRFSGPVPKPAGAGGAVDLMIRNPDGGAYTKASAFIFPVTTMAFGTKGFIASPLSSTGLDAADVDNDGRADLVHAGASSFRPSNGGPLSTNAGPQPLHNDGGSPLPFTAAPLAPG